MLKKLNKRLVAILTGTALAVAPMGVGDCDLAVSAVVDNVLDSALVDVYDNGYDDWSCTDDDLSGWGDCGCDGMGSDPYGASGTGCPDWGF